MKLIKVTKYHKFFSFQIIIVFFEGVLIIMCLKYYFFKEFPYKFLRQFQEFFED